MGEIGCQWLWTDLEKRCLTAAVVAQNATGAALTIHPARHQDHPRLLVELWRAKSRPSPTAISGPIATPLAVESLALFGFRSGGEGLWVIPRLVDRDPFAIGDVRYARGLAGGAHQTKTLIPGRAQRDLVSASCRRVGVCKHWVRGSYAIQPCRQPPQR